MQMLEGEANVREAQGDVALLLPTEPQLSANDVAGIKAFLVATFPSLSIKIGEVISELDGEVDDFVAFPVCRIVREGGQVRFVGRVSVDTCNEVVDALRAHRASGWKLRLH